MSSKQDFDGSVGDEKDEEANRLRRLHIETLRDLYCPSDIIEVVELRSVT